MAAKKNQKTDKNSGKKSGAPRQKGARKSVMTQKRKNAAQSEAIAARFKKLSVIILIVLIIFWVLGWFIVNDGPSKVSAWVKDQMLSITGEMGFTVKNILVEGREYTEADVILALINMQEGDPIFTFNPVEARRQIGKIGWVKSVHVERRLPDTIYINITERTPVALWKNGSELYLVDENGNLITQERLDRFKDLIMVSGDDAPKATEDLINLLKSAPELLKMVDNCEFLDKRRWDLMLADNKRIKLPEVDPESAISHIMERQKENKILSKEAIVEIDARYKGRLIVKTGLGKVQDYRDGD